MLMRRRINSRSFVSELLSSSGDLSGICKNMSGAVLRTLCRYSHGNPHGKDGPTQYSTASGDPGQRNQS